MDQFSYVDIFATKGFEYLLVIGFFLILVAFWSFLNRPKKEILKAEADREELRRLLDQQRDRMESELGKLRDERDQMQTSLLTQLQQVETRALDAWREAFPHSGDSPDLGKLLDWVLAERETLVEDAKRLDYLSHLVSSKPRLYRMPDPDGSVVVHADDEESGKGSDLREAIDAARNRKAA